MTCTVLDQTHKWRSSRKILAAHIWFRDGGVHREGAEYDYLKRFRKRLNGAMTIEWDWRVPKTCPRPVFLLKEKLTTGELLSPAETTMYRTVRWRFALLHARQSRCTVRGVNSGIDVGKTDSMIDDYSETRDTLLMGTRHFVNKLVAGY